MINQEKFFNQLQEAGIEFYCGVPDSYLNAFCTFITNNVPSDKHVIVANEGNAIALASGYHFATGTVPLVYMQNSGMGNALNPIVSLVDKHVYSVPMVLVIGWRGDPAGIDHDQHKTQGEITPKLLEMLNLPYKIIPDNDEEIAATVDWAVSQAKESSNPAILIAQKGVLAEKEKKAPDDDSYPMSREDAMKVALDLLPKDTLVVASTGRATRELFFLREERGELHDNDVLNVGAMGHSSSIAMGLALAKPERLVVCFDGDSSAMMHMGALTTVIHNNLPNFVHIILNNGAHESVGGQPSAGHKISFAQIARGCGYRVATVSTAEELKDAIAELTDGKGAALVDVRIKQGMRPILPPLDIDHNQIIAGFKNKNIQKEIKG
jgi:phosphonopyruvate decarboxylase